jgi:hypothetical protein
MKKILLILVLLASSAYSQDAWAPKYNPPPEETQQTKKKPKPPKPIPESNAVGFILIGGALSILILKRYLKNEHTKR